jgi:hypothetical protein
MSKNSVLLQQFLIAVEMDDDTLEDGHLYVEANGEIEVRIGVKASASITNTEAKRLYLALKGVFEPTGLSA